MVDVPTTKDVSDAGMTGLKVGGGVGIGEAIGRGIIPGPLGTLAGGIGAASMMSGNSRDTAAAIATERAVGQLFGGGGNSGGDSRRRM